MAGGIVGVLALLLLAGIAGALWQRKKHRYQRAHNVDLSDAMAPASEPATGDSMVPPNPYYSYVPPSSQSFMSEPGFAGLGVLGRNEKLATVLAQHQHRHRGVAPASPPYLQDANTHTGSSATPHTPRPNRRFSATSDSKSDGIVSLPLSQRGGSRLLPPGAAVPNTFPSMQTLEPAIQPAPDHEDHLFAFSPISPASPPPTYL